MDAKFTKGPWSVEYENEHGPEYRIVGPDGSYLFWHRWNDSDVVAERIKANATLAAAAPAMWEALRRIANHSADVTGAPQMVNIARAALKQATP